MASGNAAEHRGHRGHHDGAEAQQARLIDGLDRRQALLALGLQGKVDHHDGILLHDADEQDDADQRDDAQFGSGEQQRQNGAHAGRGQRGENRQRVDQALIENAEHDVDGDQRGQNQIGSFLSESWKACAVPWKLA